MSFYRKYRPQTFEDVVGQEHIAQTLRNALSTSPPRISHAYLFCGPRGTGKTTSARLLAKCLNCETGPTTTPCNACDFCLRVRDNQPTMDLVEIDAATNRKIEDARELIEAVVYAPSVEGRRKVYIIDEVHMMTTEAFNALLKTIEEPPAHAVFILATTDAHKVPQTIVSRCQKFDFRRVGPSDIIKRLLYVAQNENIALEENAARLIATQADGALRDALTLLEQVAAFSAASIGEADVRLVLGTVSHELLQSLMNAVAHRDAPAALRDIERATEEGVSFSQLARDLTNLCRDLLLLTLNFESDGGLSQQERDGRSEHARLMGRARLLSTVEALRATEKEMRQSTDHRLLLELALVRAASEEVRPNNGVLSASQGAPQLVAPPRPIPQQAPMQASAQVPVPASAAPIPAAYSPQKAVPIPHLEEIARPTFAPNTVVPNAATEQTQQMAPPENAPLESVSVSSKVVSAEVVSAPDELQGEPESSDSHGEADSALRTSNSALAPARKGGRRIHDLGEFVELWPAVLARVKRKIGVTAVAYLHDAYPVALDDKDATLEFKKEFHYEKACDALSRLPFEQVLNECMATPHRLKFQLAPAPKKQAAPVEAAPVHANDDFDAEVQDVHRLAQDIFAAEVVGRSGEG